MSYEFTRLPEVEVLENLTENAHLIVEDGGKTRRFPASEFSGGDTVLGEDGKLVESVLPDGYPYDFGGAEIIEDFLIDETTHNFDETRWEWETGDFTFDIELDKTYIVIWDGVEYECTAIENNSSYYTIIGNGAVFSDYWFSNTGEPFCFVNYEGTYGIAVGESNLGSHTFSVIKERTVKYNCRKIDVRLLPDGIPYFGDITTVTVIEETTFDFDSSYKQTYQCDAKVKPKLGQTYVVVWDGVEYECVAKNLFGDYVDIGNGSIASDSVENTGEPFFIEYNASVNGWIIGPDNKSFYQHTFMMKTEDRPLHKLSEELLPQLKLVGKSGTGDNSEIFNNYLSNKATNSYAHAEGHNTTADYCAHAEGDNTTASGSSSHAEGVSTTASGYSSHAEGCDTTASGKYSHVEGWMNTASGDYSHAEGSSAQAIGNGSHAEGVSTTANSKYSHAEGWATKSSSECQHVQGKWNIEDTANTYAHIVGNGASNTKRSNAHTLDWSGNAWFAGTVEGAALILKSPNGTRYQITVSDSGELSASALT